VDAVTMAGRRDNLQMGIGGAETGIYVVSALLLLVAAALTLAGTVVDVVEGSSSRRITDAGLFLLDRVLLLFMIAELLYTLRIVNLGGRILVEPFLFIGLIAAVRKVLVVAAEGEEEGLSTTELVVQIGGFGGLVLLLALAIFLLRRSAPVAAPQ
jgi:protein-S-isoprenylcysteine O-methyltransferase Ste14